MKVAVFSDVQANLPAFQEAVEHIRAWHPDLVISNGDLVNRGPLSLDCLDLMHELETRDGWIGLRGNHEDFVLYCGQEPPKDENDRELRLFTDWTVKQLGTRAQDLQHWGLAYEFHAAGHPTVSGYVTHGTPADNRRGVLQSTPDEALREVLPKTSPLFITAHTHRPLMRRVDGISVINIGSVGSPFDGDVRGSFGLFEFQHGEWHAHIERFDYDRVRAERDYEESGFLDEGGPMAWLIYQEWKQARSLMPQWHQYWKNIRLNEDISMQEAAHRFISLVN